MSHAVAGQERFPAMGSRRALPPLQWPQAFMQSLVRECPVSPGNFWVLRREVQQPLVWQHRGNQGLGINYVLPLCP